MMQNFKVFTIKSRLFSSSIFIKYLNRNLYQNSVLYTFTSAVPFLRALYMETNTSVKRDEHFNSYKHCAETIRNTFHINTTIADISFNRVISPNRYIGLHIKGPQRSKNIQLFNDVRIKITLALNKKLLFYPHFSSSHFKNLN